MMVEAPLYGRFFLYLRDRDGKPIQLSFDEDSDRQLTESILGKNRKKLDFILRIDDPKYQADPQRFYLYLGHNPSRSWDEDYAISLDRSYGFDGKPFWVASTGSALKGRMRARIIKAAQTTQNHDRTSSLS